MHKCTNESMISCNPLNYAGVHFKTRMTTNGNSIYFPAQGRLPSLICHEMSVVS